MSPWTALLQSLHSALIDEVTDRHPEPKPELGLPKRQNQFHFPSEAITAVLVVDVSFGVGDQAIKGAAMIGFQPEFLQALHLSASELWDAMLKRAGSEFARRSIRPIFGKPELLSSASGISQDLLSFSRVVWIPIALPGCEGWFGVAAP